MASVRLGVIFRENKVYKKMKVCVSEIILHWYFSVSKNTMITFELGDVQNFGGCQAPRAPVLTQALHISVKIWISDDLTCIFFSVRAIWKETFQCETPGPVQGWQPDSIDCQKISFW